MNRKINRDLNSFRGFTLIELLAVIVVLAIIILIAVQAVLPQMDRAQRSVFAIEANGAIQAAQTYFTTGKLMGNNIGDILPVNDGGWKCVPIEKLIDQGFSELEKGTYNGRVEVYKKGTLYYYKVWLQKNKEYMIMAAGATKDEGSYINEDVDLDDVRDYDETTWNKSDSCPNTVSDSSWQ